MHTNVGDGHGEEKKNMYIQHVRVRMFTYLPKENRNHNNITNGGHGGLRTHEIGPP